MRDQDDSPRRERWEGGYDDAEGNEGDKTRELGKHRSKDKSKSSRSEEKDHRGRDRERSKTSDISKEIEKDVKESERERASSRSKRKESRDEREKDRKVREKDIDRDKYKEKDRVKEKEKERERGRETEKDRDRDREKERERGKDRERDKDREKHKDREYDRDGDRDKVKERTREKERDVDKDRSREKDNVRRKDDEKLKTDDKDNILKSTNRELNAEAEPRESRISAVELEERILKAKEERLKQKSEGSSDVLAWVSKSRKLEEKRNVQKEKALQLSKVFAEQDDIIQGESDDDDDDDEAAVQHDLSGVKVLHGLDKVIEGGAVVLTLKDQNILANGDINDDVDMLENVEIGEQKQRSEAYKAAKKKAGIYVDKFNEDPGSERKILPQYDDPIADEGVTLDANGRFSKDTEKKLEELRRRIEGVGTRTQVEDLNSMGNKTASDYFTQEEMLKFKKPKKKKSLRKKEKLDVNALEAEAVSAGLGVGDLGSRKDGKRQALKEEQEKSEAERRTSAYQSAYARAAEASKALKLEQQTSTKKPNEEDETMVFDDDDEDLRKSLDRARRLALKKKDDEAVVSGPSSMALLASVTSKDNDTSAADNGNLEEGEPQENKVVFTEMEEFVWGLQHDEETHKPEGENVFMDEDEVPKTSGKERKDENNDDGGWSEVKDATEEEAPKKQDKEEIVPDETIHEAAVGKGLSGALKLLKDRGSLGQGIEWGGRNMDKKKSKLVGIYANDGTKEIRIERTDEYGRILTPKESFRLLSHKFHGKGPGKMKQEKRMRQYEEEQKVKQMRNSDTPSLSAERMRDAQAKLKTPYLVLSGNVKPGQTSDPRSGFATVEKDFPGGLTPMLGDRKVEHFLGIKRKSDAGDMGPPPPRKPKT